MADLQGGKKVENPPGKQIAKLEPLMVSADDVATLIGVGRSLFYRMLASGRFAPLSVTFGCKKKLWSLEELKAWVRAGCPAQSEGQRMQREKK